MKKVNKVIDTVMRFLMAVAMFALIAGGFWQIFSRWILRNPSTFTDEFLRYILIWASMLGSAYCFYKDQHLALDLLKDKTKGVVVTNDDGAAPVFAIKPDRNPHRVELGTPITEHGLSKICPWTGSAVLLLQNTSHLPAVL